MIDWVKVLLHIDADRTIVENGKKVFARNTHLAYEEDVQARLPHGLTNTRSIEPLSVLDVTL